MLNKYGKNVWINEWKPVYHKVTQTAEALDLKREDGEMQSYWVSAWNTWSLQPNATRSHRNISPRRNKCPPRKTGSTSAQLWFQSCADLTQQLWGWKPIALQNQMCTLSPGTWTFSESLSQLLKLSKYLSYDQFFSPLCTVKDTPWVLSSQCFDFNTPHPSLCLPREDISDSP